MPIQMPFVRTFVTAIAASLSVLVGCAAKETGDPVPVGISVEFPSTPTAVVTDSVRIFVYDGAQDCANLVSIRSSGRPLPASRIEQQRTPCDLLNGVDVGLERNHTYTVLVVGQVAQKDLLVGCTQQQQFGDVVAVPVTLAYASSDFTLSTLEATAPGSTTKCAKLSDKCSHACAP